MGSSTLTERARAQLVRGVIHHAPGPRDHLREEFFGSRFPRVRRALRGLKDAALRTAARAGVVIWTPSFRDVATETAVRCRFAIDHFSVHAEETALFATAE